MISGWAAGSGRPPSANHVAAWSGDLYASVLHGECPHLAPLCVKRGHSRPEQCAPVLPYPFRIVVRFGHQGTTPASSKKPPLGPSWGRVARRMAIAAPSSGVRIPRNPLRSVAQKPGHAALIKMLVPASSLAYWTVTALRNVFEGAYAAAMGPVSAPGVVCRVSEPTLLDMFTIRGDAERRSSGSMALVTRMTPITLVSTAASIRAGSTEVGDCGAPPVIPALLTRTSNRPARFS